MTTQKLNLTSSQRLDLQYLKDCKRALERLNPKRLSFGAFDYETQCCCATFATAAHRYKKNKISPLYYLDKAKWAWYRMDNEHLESNSKARYTDQHIALEVNDNYRRGDNSEAAQKARYKHVYKWVCKQIEKIEK